MFDTSLIDCSLEALNYSGFLHTVKKSVIQMFSFCLGRFVTPDELDGLILYLKDKRARLLRSAADPLTGERKDALKLGSR